MARYGRGESGSMLLRTRLLRLAWLASVPIVLSGCSQERVERMERCGTPMSEGGLPGLVFCSVYVFTGAEWLFGLAVVSTLGVMLLKWGAAGKGAATPHTTEEADDGPAGQDDPPSDDAK